MLNPLPSKQMKWTPEKPTPAWIAYFDILGYTQLILEQKGIHTFVQQDISYVTEALEETISYLDKHNHVKYFLYADSFLIYSYQLKAYPIIDSACTGFIDRAIRNQLPVRGAIAYGELIFGEISPESGKIIQGKHFLEAYSYCENQDWFGLLLTPSTQSALKSIKLDPPPHHFIEATDSIPFEEDFLEDPPFNRETDKIHAYTFSKGQTNFQSPLIRTLEQLLNKNKNKKPTITEKVTEKYSRTIEWIKKHDGKIVA